MKCRRVCLTQRSMAERQMSARWARGEQKSIRELIAISIMWQSTHAVLALMYKTAAAATAAAQDKHTHDTRTDRQVYRKCCRPCDGPIGGQSRPSSKQITQNQKSYMNLFVGSVLHSISIDFELVPMPWRLMARPKPATNQIEKWLSSLRLSASDFSLLSPIININLHATDYRYTGNSTSPGSEPAFGEIWDGKLLHV